MKVIAVRFKAGGKSYFFDPGDIDIAKDDHCIVETVKGIEYAQACSDIQEVDEARIPAPLRKIMRKATEADDRQVEENAAREKNAYKIAQEKIAEHGLDMKLTEVEYAFDNSKIIFFFVAEQRVDFRDLVKDLAGIFRTRIELRQIGVRDEARSLGGFGSCGRPLCCAEFLSDFVPVSIKMAKEQNLSLNPTKISGVCGRLMCCLKYEEEAYEELNSTMPALGDYVVTSDGTRGEVSGINVLRQIAKVLVEVGDDKELRDYPAGEITVLRRKKGKRGGSHIGIAAEDSPEMLALLEDEAREMKAEADRNARENGRQDRGKEGRTQSGQQQNRGDRQDNDRGDRKNRQDRQNRQERQDGDRQERQNGQGGEKQGRDRRNQGGERQNRNPQDQERREQDGQGQQGKNHRNHHHRNRDNRPKNKESEGGAGTPNGTGQS